MENCNKLEIQIGNLCFNYKSCITQIKSTSIYINLKFSLISRPANFQPSYLLEFKSLQNASFRLLHFQVNFLNRLKIVTRLGLCGEGGIFQLTS